MEKRALYNLYLLFQLGRESFGITTQDVIEIVGLPRVTAVPQLPAYIRGLVNMRGRIVPVIDLRLRLGMEQSPYGERTCLVVVRGAGELIGLVVDAVDCVLEIDSDSIEPPPNDRLSRQFIAGLAKTKDRVRLLLDLQSITEESTQSGVNKLDVVGV